MRLNDSTETAIENFLADIQEYAVEYAGYRLCQEKGLITTGVDEDVDICALTANLYKVLELAYEDGYSNCYDDHRL